MKTALENIKSTAAEAIGSCDDPKALDALRVRFLGKKGELTAILKQMGKLSAEERPVMGQLANEVRAAIESAITEKARTIPASHCAFFMVLSSSHRYLSKKPE